MSGLTITNINGLVLDTGVTVKAFRPVKTARYWVNMRILRKKDELKAAAKRRRLSALPQFGNRSRASI